MMEDTASQEQTECDDTADEKSLSPRANAIQLLMESSGASWKDDETKDDLLILSNVRYADEDPLQSLDIYFPKDGIESTTTKYCVYIHIHGGGWSRGGKSSPVYGGPGMSIAAVQNYNCIAVAPGYRLGTYPDFMYDTATAIQWVRDNIEALGGDLSNVFLSGHSAGGHIASLLLLRHETFLGPLGIPVDFFKGLVLVSGVFDLFNPLQKNIIDTKNKWFLLAYVLPAFGSDEQLRRDASPLLLLDPDKDTSILGVAAMKLCSRIGGSFNSRSSSAAESTTSQEEAATQTEDVTVDVNTENLPPTLVLNATLDMGLQENGKLFAAAMSKHTDCKHIVISGTDHASICWNQNTATEIEGFLKSCMSTKDDP